MLLPFLQSKPRRFAWMRQEQLPPVWFIGYDFGGMVGQILALQHPDLLARMTIRWKRRSGPAESSWAP